MGSIRVPEADLGAPGPAQEIRRQRADSGRAMAGLGFTI